MTGRIASLAVALCALSGPLWSQTLSTSNTSRLLDSQLRVLDTRAAQQYNDSVRLQPPSVNVPGAPGSAPAYRGGYSGPWLSVARGAARRYGVPEDLFLRLVHQESRWNAGAVSSKGALGLAQLMPGTARRLGVDPRDPQENLEGGARYLRLQYDTFGSWPLALAAYNAGPKAVQRYGGVPPYRETEAYVKVIWGG